MPRHSLTRVKRFSLCGGFFSTVPNSIQREIRRTESNTRGYPHVFECRRDRSAFGNGVPSRHGRHRPRSMWSVVPVWQQRLPFRVVLEVQRRLRRHLRKGDAMLLRVQG